jgi:hypothetical protein
VIVRRRPAGGIDALLFRRKTPCYKARMADFRILGPLEVSDETGPLFVNERQRKRSPGFVAGNGFVPGVAAHFAAIGHILISQLPSGKDDWP